MDGLDGWVDVGGGNVGAWGRVRAGKGGGGGGILRACILAADAWPLALSASNSAARSSSSSCSICDQLLLLLYL